MQAQSLANSCLCGLHCYTSQALNHINEAVEESFELVAAFALYLWKSSSNQKTDNMSQERGVMRRIQKVNAEKKIVITIEQSFQNKRECQ